MTDKIFNFELPGSEDATLRYPADMELSLTERQGIVAYGMQKAIIEGLTRKRHINQSIRIDPQTAT